MGKWWSRSSRKLFPWKAKKVSERTVGMDLDVGISSLLSLAAFVDEMTDSVDDRGRLFLAAMGNSVFMYEECILL